MFKAFYALIAALGAMAGFGGAVHAANVVDPQDGGLDLAQAVYSALTGGHYAFAAALTLVATVALIRKFGGMRWKWVHTDLGGAALIMGGAFGTALAAALTGGGPLTMGALETAGIIGFTTMGGYAAVKKILVEPMLVPLAARLPAWARLPLTAVIWWFEHKSDDQGNTPATPAVPQP